MHTILRWIDSIQTIKEESGKEMKPLIKLAAKKKKKIQPLIKLATQKVKPLIK